MDRERRYSLKGVAILNSRVCSLSLMTLSVTGSGKGQWTRKKVIELVSVQTPMLHPSRLGSFDPADHSIPFTRLGSSPSILAVSVSIRHTTASPVSVANRPTHHSFLQALHLA
jgi:hypothetical protein